MIALKPFQLILCVINALSAIFSICANFPVCISIWRTESLHSPSNVIIFCLALADVGVGIIVQPFLIVCLIDIGNATLYIIFQVFCSYFVGASVIAMALLAVDRCLAVYLHLRYQGIVTTRRTVLFCTVCWLIDTAMIAMYASIDYKGFIIMATSATITCIAVVAVCYFIIFRTVRRHRKQIRDQRRAICAAEIRHGKSLRNMFYLHGFYALSLAPMAVYFAYTVFEDLFVPYAWLAAATCALMNSSANPLLYFWRMRDIRKAVLKMLGKFSKH